MTSVIGYADPMTSTLNELADQARANSLRWFPHSAEWTDREVLMHYGLGITEEAGEVAGVIKKATGYTFDNPQRRTLDELPGELVDALTYLLSLAGFLGIDLEAAWEANLAKCEARWAPLTEATA